MDTKRVAAILFIAGFVVGLLGLPFSVPGLYSTSDPQARVAIIEAHKPNWLISQVVATVTLLLPAIAFAALAWGWRGVAKPWISEIGAVVVAASTILGVIFVYLQTIDPLDGYGGAYSGLENLGSGLALVGLLIFGVAFLINRMPAWLGYLTIGASVAYGIVFIVSGTGWFTPGILILLGIAIAIVLLRAAGHGQTQAPQGH